ncbi:MAG: DUF3455 domain-containing protein [Candidatus Solibacter sp.]
MNHIFHHRTKKPSRGRTALVATLALGCLFGTVNQAAAQTVTPPATPTLITPKEGNTAFLLGRAQGTQGYVCLPTAPGASTASWTVNGARPEATLFTKFFGQDVQIITHFLSPDTNPNGVLTVIPFGSATWQSSFDTSKVWAAVLNGAAVQPSTDIPSCPHVGSIACLLLTSIGSQSGPTRGNLLTPVTFVQRLNTNGGSAPADGCSVSTDVGKQTLVPYTADYYFYKADTKYF